MGTVAVSSSSTSAYSCLSAPVVASWASIGGGCSAFSRIRNASAAERISSTSAGS
jgi:hypothetical protein